jgi:hypothetical protein
VVEDDAALQRAAAHDLPFEDGTVIGANVGVAEVVDAAEVLEHLGRRVVVVLLRMLVRCPPSWT